MKYTIIGYRLQTNYQAIPVEAESAMAARENIINYYKKMGIGFKVCFVIEDHPKVHSVHD